MTNFVQQNKDKKIAIFLPSLRGGGAERGMLTLGKGLAERGLNVDLVLAKAEGHYLTQVPPTIRLIDFQEKRVVLTIPKLSRYLHQQRPIALLSAMDYANIIALWARGFSGISTRLVVSVQNTLSLSIKNSANRRSRLIPFLIHYFYPWADQIVAISQGVADDLALTANLPRQQIQVIYNPVVTSEMLTLAQMSVNHPWFAPGEPPVILGVGRLTKQKDFATLIRAFALVRQHYVSRLVILGEGEERAKLEELVRSLGLEDAVSMPGFVSNPYAYMAKASVFVLSSLWEGLGMVLIEALALGTPVVSTDCQSGPSEILEEGKYGQLVTVGSVKEMANAILNRLQNPASAKLLKSRAMNFSVENIQNQYLKLFFDSR